MHTSTIHEFMASERSDFNAFKSFLKSQISTEVMPPEAIDALQSPQVYQPIYQGIPSFKTWLELLGRFTGLPSTVQIPEGYRLKETISYAFAKKQHMIPLIHEAAGTSAYIFSNPFSLPLLDWLEYSESTQIYLATPFWIEQFLDNALAKQNSIKNDQAMSENIGEDPHLTPPNQLTTSNLSKLIDKVQNQQAQPLTTPNAWSELANISSPLKAAEAGPAQAFLQHLFQSALTQKVSHIHLESTPQIQINFRHGSQLQPAPDLGPTPPLAALIIQLKLMGQLDISTQQSYQEGEIFFQVENQLYPVQLHILPLASGEKAILSLPVLRAESHPFENQTLQVLQNYLHKPGLILSLGPTPNFPFKAALNKKVVGRNITALTTQSSLPLQGISQHLFSPQQGVSYAAMMTLLSHESDILLLDQYPHLDYFKTACNLALQGKTILAPMGYHDPAAALLYLLEQNLPAYLLGSALSLLCVQHLLPTLCVQCRLETAETAPPAFELAKHYYAPGCAVCHQSGQGEPLTLLTAIPWERDLEAYLYSESINALTLRDLLKQKSSPSLREQGLAKVKSGEVGLSALQALLG